MNPLAEQVAKRRIDRPLAVEAAEATKPLGDDLDGEVAFAAGVMAGVSAMFLAVVNDLQALGSERRVQALGDFLGDGAG